MLSPKTQYRLANAKEYFEEHLCAGDYYSEGQSIAGQWFGKSAESLQITGTVRRDEFLRLCDNLDLRTGNRFTQRLKTTRTLTGDTGEVREVANRPPATARRPVTIRPGSRALRSTKSKADAARLRASVNLPNTSQHPVTRHHRRKTFSEFFSKRVKTGYVEYSEIS